MRRTIPSSARVDALTPHLTTVDGVRECIDETSLFNAVDENVLALNLALMVKSHRCVEL
jgi:hypothetical protein